MEKEICDMGHVAMWTYPSEKIKTMNSFAKVRGFICRMSPL